jgi:hypothetical protein
MAARIKINDTGLPDNEWIVVRKSPVHGYGCFARKFIPKGTRIIEYLGERLSHKEADKRYEDADPNDNHTFLFIADRKTVIDATYGGNESRFINHSCDGNCTSETEKGRVFIDAIKDIQKGEELNYDYQIPRDKDDPPNVDEIYACRCGSPKCRGSMLWPPMKKKKKAKKKTAARSGSAAKSRAGRKGKAGKKTSAAKGKKATAKKGKKAAPARRTKAGSRANAKKTAGKARRGKSARR